MQYGGISRGMAYQEVMKVRYRQSPSWALYDSSDANICLGDILGGDMLDDYVGGNR
jgi:hypothetical protein